VERNLPVPAEEAAMKYTRRSFVAVAAALIVSACAKNTAPRTADEPTTLKVDNQAMLDMNIYVLRSSQRIRLGTATGLTTTRFTIPPYVLFGATSLRFLADPIGSNRTPVSDEITVTAGDEITLMIPPTY